MKGSISGKGSQGLIDARVDAWMWLLLCKKHKERYKEKTFPVDDYETKDFRGYLIERTSGWEFRLYLEMAQYSLLPQEYLDWIVEDERQTNWLLSYINNEFERDTYSHPVRLFGRNMVVARIDLFPVELGEKAKRVEEMRIQWNRHLAGDVVFKWFKEKESEDRCKLAWEWLVEKGVRGTRNNQAVGNYKSLLMFYDQLGITEERQRLDVIEIKRRWSQRKYREKMTGKSQYNFLLSDSSIAGLDKLAAKYEMTRPKIIEALIKLEVEKESYLPRVARRNSQD